MLSRPMMMTMKVKGSQNGIIRLSERGKGVMNYPKRDPLSTDGKRTDITLAESRHYLGGKSTLPWRKKAEEAYG